MKTISSLLLIVGLSQPSVLHMIIDCTAMMQACPVEVENPFTHETRQVFVPLIDVIHAFDWDGSEYITPMQAAPLHYDYSFDDDVPST